MTQYHAALPSGELHGEEEERASSSPGAFILAGWMEERASSSLFDENGIGSILQVPINMVGGGSESRLGGRPGPDQRTDGLQAGTGSSRLAWLGYGLPVPARGLFTDLWDSGVPQGSVKITLWGRVNFRCDWPAVLQSTEVGTLTSDYQKQKQKVEIRGSHAICRTLSFKLTVKQIAEGGRRQLDGWRNPRKRRSNLRWLATGPSLTRDWRRLRPTKACSPAVAAQHQAVLGLSSPLTCPACPPRHGLFEPS
jgi:hypothetical protein